MAAVGGGRRVAVEVEVRDKNPFIDEKDGNGFHLLYDRVRGQGPVNGAVVEELVASYGFMADITPSISPMTHKLPVYMISSNNDGCCQYVLQPGDNGFKIFGELVNNLLTMTREWRRRHTLSSFIETFRKSYSCCEWARKVTTPCPMRYISFVVVRPLEKLGLPFSVLTKLRRPGLPTPYIPVCISFSDRTVIQLVMRNNINEKRIIFAYDDRYTQSVCSDISYIMRELVWEEHARVVCPVIRRLSENNRWRWERHLRRSVILHRVGVQNIRKLGK